VVTHTPQRSSAVPAGAARHEIIDPEDSADLREHVDEGFSPWAPKMARISAGPGPAAAHQCGDMSVVLGYFPGGEDQIVLSEH